MDLDLSLPWLALRLTPGLGARLAGKLLRQFGAPEEIFRASRLAPAARSCCGWIDRQRDMIAEGRL